MGGGRSSEQAMLVHQALVENTNLCKTRKSSSSNNLLKEGEFSKVGSKIPKGK